jgi:hypothetical protein
MQTPNFLKSLTDLSQSIVQYDEKEFALKSGLQALNLSLSASVYIPFIT